MFTQNLGGPGDGLSGAEPVRRHCQVPVVQPAARVAFRAMHAAEVVTQSPPATAITAVFPAGPVVFDVPGPVIADHDLVDPVAQRLGHGEVLASREERLYVDYIEDEHGDRRWTGPADQAAVFDEPFSFPAPASTVVRLVAAMRCIGLLTEQGLAATRAIWDGVEMDDTMPWSDLRPLNVADLKRERERWLAQEMGVVDDLTDDYGPCI